MKSSTKNQSAAHTPGPWHVGLAARERAIYGPKGEHIATLPDMLFDGEILANVRLIAAAPELLAALQESLKQIEAVRLSGYITSETFDGSLQKTGNTIRSALARAKQGQS